MQLHGIHHITAVTANASENLAFYTQVLGLRLVKKTVNQDDTSAYHLFYADKLGTPGTDMTFFEWAGIGENTQQTDAIVRTLFRVASEAALEYWITRFDEKHIQHSGMVTFHSRKALLFADGEGQQLGLVSDEHASFEGEAWDGSDVAVEHAIHGFFAAQLAIPHKALLDGLFTHLLNWEVQGNYKNPQNNGENVIVYAMDGGGAGKEVHVIERPGKLGRLGAGGVHHIAFRLKDQAEQQQWLMRLGTAQMPNSGLVDRFYFQSLYFRVSEGILFELATDGPGFATDESPETMGTHLALPPFLEAHRTEIESGLHTL